jgi:hypothetical protein
LLGAFQLLSDVHLKILFDVVGTKIYAFRSAVTVPNGKQKNVLERFLRRIK